MAHDSHAATIVLSVSLILLTSCTTTSVGDDIPAGLRLQHGGRLRRRQTGTWNAKPTTVGHITWAAHGSLMPQFASRPSFSGDPLPFRYTVATAVGVVEVRSATDPFGNREYRPRPNLVLPQTNQTNIVLTHIRDRWAARGDKVLAWQAKRYLDEVDIDALGAPAEHVEHARAVLTRLAALAPAGGTLDLRQDRSSRPTIRPSAASPALTVQRDNTDPYATFVIRVMGVIVLAHVVAVAALELPRLIGG